MTIKNPRKKSGEYTASCVSCGTLVTEDQKFVKEGKNFCTSCAIISKKQDPAIRVPEGPLKWLCYMVSLLSPFAGFVLGVIYYSQSGFEQSRRFGKNCFIIMTFSIALIMAFLVISAVFGAVGLGGSYTGMNIGEGYY